MPCCAECEGIEQEFDARRAASRLRKWRRKGPDRTTAMLIEDLQRALGNEAGRIRVGTLLDIGGGVGAIHHLLLEHDVDRATHVDASSAYLAAAREETTRVGHADRVNFMRGDFVDVAERVPRADVVTLDRVICCYHDMPRLVARSAERAGRLYGAVYPRSSWWVRAGIDIENAFLRLKGTSFRAYLHPPADIDAVLRAAGLERRSVRRTMSWEVTIYERRAR